MLVTKDNLQLSGLALNTSIPKVPNFLCVWSKTVSGPGDNHVLPISAFTNDALREIGAAWTERLVERAEQLRSGEDAGSPPEG